MFQMTHDIFEQLVQANGFELGPPEVVLFGLRGCLPIEWQDLQLLPTERIEPVALDWVHPRCAIGIWDRGRQLVGATAGSTVPTREAAQVSFASFRAGSGDNANQMLPSLVAFTKGMHLQSKVDRRYPAFQQHGDFALWRTRDDAQFEDDDAIVVGAVGDNLHAAFVNSPAGVMSRRTSEGCQVVIGSAKRVVGPNRDIGMWPVFRDTANASGQERFRYILLDAADAQRAAVASVGTIPLRLRYGSSGPVVRKLQARLKRLGLLASDEKGTLAKFTLLAVVGFQRSQGLTPDGVVGPNTAAALGIADDWPRF